jgi:hypothetical protein
VVGDLEFEHGQVGLREVSRCLGLDQERGRTTPDAGVEFVSDAGGGAKAPQGVQPGFLDRAHAGPPERPSDSVLVSAAARERVECIVLSKQPEVQTE